MSDKKIKAKVYIVGGTSLYEAHWLKRKFDIELSTFEKSDIVIFTGGSDIDPAFYGEQHHISTYCNHSRDTKELEFAQAAINQNKFIIGICRGGQLGCVMAGGRLIQDVAHHRSNHNMVYRQTVGSDKMERCVINSIHHQMMWPYNLDKTKYTLLGWCTKDDFPKSQYYKYQGANSKEFEIKNVQIKDISNFMEPEVVFFKEISWMSIQCHPEMMSGNIYEKALDKLTHWTQLYFKIWKKNQDKNEFKKIFDKFEE